MISALIVPEGTTTVILQYTYVYATLASPTLEDKVLRYEYFFLVPSYPNQ